MKKTKEKGVTLIALVITIIVLLILVSIGTNSGMSTIEFAKYNELKNELKMLQSKVDELNQNNEINIGEELTEEQKNIVNRIEVANIIYKDCSGEEKEKIEKGFRYCDVEYIQENFGLDSVKRDYLINVEYRYVVCSKGFDFEGTTYYMINQMGDGVYNVKYNNKNNKNQETSSYEVNCVKENDKWKIEVTDITYEGYINDWQVKYRLDGDTYWKTAIGLKFYVKEPGNYYVEVVHDDISLGSQLVSIIDDTDNAET